MIYKSRLGNVVCWGTLYWCRRNSVNSLSVFSDSVRASFCTNMSWPSWLLGNKHVNIMCAVVEGVFSLLTSCVTNLPRKCVFVYPFRLRCSRCLVTTIVNTYSGRYAPVVCLRQHLTWLRCRASEFCIVPGDVETSVTQLKRATRLGSLMLRIILPLSCLAAAVRFISHC